VILRPVALSDENRLLAWRNDPATRASAFNEEEVTADEHSAWFARKLSDAACAMLIAEDAGEPVAQVRLERVEPDVAEIHIAVDPAARGRGVGREVLRLAVAEGRSRLEVSRVRAHVKANNMASLRAFRAAGFVVTSETRNVVELERPAVA
jgi:RimJ/RimL family protein N-acetyltransferase